MTVLAVDVGRTDIRAALDGERITMPGGPTLADADGAERLAGLIATCLQELGGHKDDLVVVVAAAGALGGNARAVSLAESVAIATKATGVVVTGDVVAAHAAAFAGGPGVLLAIGTGAVALTGGPDGVWRWVGGEGYLLGDAGGGFAIGRAGLLAALRNDDGRQGGSAALADAATLRFGPLLQLPGLLHAETDPARTIATFTPSVARAARARDPVACAIWDGAVDDLVDLISRACAGMPSQARRVALSGGLAAVDDLVAGPLRSRVATLSPNVVVLPTIADPVVGAAALAGPDATAYEPLLVRHGRAGGAAERSQQRSSAHVPEHAQTM